MERQLRPFHLRVGDRFAFHDWTSGRHRMAVYEVTGKPERAGRSYFGNVVQWRVPTRVVSGEGPLVWNHRGEQVFFTDEKVRVLQRVPRSVPA